MKLLPNIPASVMMRQELKHYHGLHHGNKLYLSFASSSNNNKSQKLLNPMCSQNHHQPRQFTTYF